MRSRLASLALISALAALAAGSGSCASADVGSGAGSGVATSGDFAGPVTLADGRRLYLECHGSGSTTVVFEAGLRGRGDVWSYSVAGGEGTGVFPRVTAFTRACTYDRPGTLLGLNQLSRSDPVPMPRSTGEVVADLHQLLSAAGVPGPYVIVGSSTGGLIARQYTRAYPGEVAGLVLVDALSERVQDLMRPRQFARYNRRYLQSPSPEVLGYSDLERIDFYRSFAEMRGDPRPPARLPMVVISKQRSFGVPSGVSRRFARMVDRVWRKAQTYLASLEPGIKRVIAVGSGHHVLVNRPGLVARMVRLVVARVRGG
jgi:pimeloyl-ACP methyl ester carboxylesterase